MTNTPNKSVIAAGNDVVIAEIEIAAPPERVFRALTDESELTRWFTDPSCPVKLWKMDARPGGLYRYVTEKGTIVVNNVSEFECHGEVLECVPPRLLVYTWLSNWHENKSLRTIVRWELTPTDSGTHVKVTHTGLASEQATRKNYSTGWPDVLLKLKKFVEK
jgi:uncharacterized protein YndB with AHSA1/START domain